MARLLASIPSPLGQAAGAYAAERGWAVFPLHARQGDGCSCGKPACDSPAKHPRTQHGLNDASTDPNRIAAWWANSPNANVGLATGRGLVVIDVDGEDGRSSLAVLEGEQEPLPTTLTARTGKGEHRYYRAPESAQVRNSASTKLGRGLDVRGEGGYVVAPPSEHHTGRRYEWRDPEQPMAELPAWLLERLVPAPIERAAAPVVALPTDSNRERLYAARALQSETGRVSSAGEGTRNQELNRAAYNLGQLVAGGLLSEREVVEPLFAAARGAGLGEQEIGRTIGSGLKAGALQPRGAPIVEAPPAALRPAASKRNGSEGRSEGDEGSPSGKPRLTDLGNAARLIDRHGDHLRYCPDYGRWLIWDGKRWAPNVDGEVRRRAHETVRALLAEAADETDADARKALVKHAQGSEHSARISALLTEAEVMRPVPVRSDALDADPCLLTVANGTLDLRTGDLREHRPDDLITKLMDVEYDARAECPTWLAFLQRVFAEDADLTAFVRRAIGYSLTGRTDEQVLFLLHGNGANGKSTMVELLRELLGDYAQNTPASTLLQRGSSGEGVPNDVARLPGARLVTTAETGDGRRLDEERVKAITGGDVISARFMRAEWFDFRPSFKLWISTNHRPEVRGTDHAIWRRILLVPFEVTIPDAEQDKELPRKLCSELPGILAWAVRGCLEWREQGLAAPEVVKAATGRYREEMDVLGTFIADRCVLGPDKLTPTAELYASYAEWAKEAGEHVMSQTRFGRRLKERGLTDGKVRGVRSWFGIDLGQSI